MDSRLYYGEPAVLEVKVQNVLLSSLYPSETSVVTWSGTLQKRAPYDDKDTIRLFCPNDEMKVRVIKLANIRKLNGQPFHYTPPLVLKNKPQTELDVEVEGSKGNKYTLTIYPSGRIICSCPGFGFHGKCSHAEKYLKEHGE